MLLVCFQQKEERENQFVHQYLGRVQEALKDDGGRLLDFLRLLHKHKYSDESPSQVGVTLDCMRRQLDLHQVQGPMMSVLYPCTLEHPQDVSGTTMISYDWD